MISGDDKKMLFILFFFSINDKGRFIKIRFLTRMRACDINENGVCNHDP